MTKPFMPSRPSGEVSRISAQWLCQLMDCIEYAMDHPRGDGSTILNFEGGILKAEEQTGGSGGDGVTYDGPFAVGYDEEKSVLKIAKGYYQYNGFEFGVMPESELAPATGTLCLRLTRNNGEPSLEYEIGDPDETHYPIAAITKSGDSVTIVQYYTTTAVFMVARKCRFAARKTQ